MRTHAVASVLCLLLATAGASAQTAPAKPIAIAGKWTMTLELSIGTATPALEFKQDGEKITGTYTGRYGVSALTGTLKERTIQFSFTVDAEGQASRMSFRGEVAADGLTMRGGATIEGLGDATWSAKKNPEK